LIDRLLSLFKEHEPEKDEHDISLACAALLAEVMHADHTLEKEEVAALRQALQDLFRITSAETDALLAQAADQVQKSNDLFQFTKVINDTFSGAEKIRLVHGLWSVAYSDSELDKYEEHMIRKVADLLYVPHSDFIRARNAARDGEPPHV
tara:strand:- start:224731 stop:225180 length:450 start_codon:yes stop_codon:yes gene_type:complete